MALVFDAKGSGGTTRKIDDAAADKGAPIVDFDLYRFAGVLVDDPDDSPEGKETMGRRHGIGVHHFTRRSAGRRRVPGRPAALIATRISGV